MSLRKLPEAKRFERPQNFQFDPPSDVFAKWAEQPIAAESSGDNVISIFDIIGEDPWTGGGFTARRTSAALRSIGERDVKVQINSPGGDMFEGMAIYNLLRKHNAKVTVEVFGMAASAASIIAMAGDEIVMGGGSFIMVHKAWGLVIGNEFDFADAAETFAGFDGALADIYEARTGLKRDDIETLMSHSRGDGTWLGATAAVEKGFADRVDEGMAPDTANASNDNRQIMARRQTEAALAKAGFTRAQRSDMLSNLISDDPAQRDASRDAARDAGDFTVAARQLIDILKN